MDSNSVYNKLQEFARYETISLNKFKSLLRDSSRYSKIRVTWKTEEGNVDTYYFYWDSSAYVGGSAGGSQTKSPEMVNLQGDGFIGNWRTLTYSTITECRYKGQNYYVRS